MYGTDLWYAARKSEEANAWVFGSRQVRESSRKLACEQRTSESAPNKPVEIRLLIVAYARRKEVTYTDSKLVYHPKKIPALSPSRTQSALMFRGFLGVLRGHSGASWESQIEGDK